MKRLIFAALLAITWCLSPCPQAAAQSDDLIGEATAIYTDPAGEIYVTGERESPVTESQQSTAVEMEETSEPLFSTLATPPQMSSGFYYPTWRTWTGDGGGSTGDPKQPYNDGSPGGRIYGYLEKRYESDIGTQHVGLDVRMSKNEPVYAICDGVIHRMWKQVSNDPTYWALIVKHYLHDGTVFYGIYGHCENLSSLPVGASVKGGQQIGICREDPNWHVHFGVNIDISKMKGFGRIPIGDKPSDYGWVPPRTWLLSKKPKLSGSDSVSAPKLTITAAGDKSTAKPGETFTVTYTVTNTGNATAYSISVATNVPSSTTVIGSSPSGSMSGSNYVVSLSSLAAGAKTTITVTYGVL